MPTRILFAVTVFLSAFLLFQVQPLMGRYVLPWFGGGPGVWTTCMLFFQVALLVGYGYAHLLSTALSARRQALVHGAVLALTLLTLPIVPDLAWRPSGDDEPVGHILLLLTLSVGGPFAVLAASAPLLASWYRLALPGGSPYRLYALSNAGSLLALLGYPFVVEPSLGLGFQGAAWSWAYGMFALVCAGCAWQLARRGGGGATAAAAAGPGAAPPLVQTLVWVLMSAVGSVVLLATTSRMSQEVSVVPLLWVLPLAVYLLTFILCFERDGWYDRRVVLPLLAVSLAAVLVTLFRVTHIDFRVEVAVLVVAQFACCMVCHGELVRRRPAERYLTRFYLALSAGGAAGGVLTAIVAPLVFTRYWEYHLGLAATVVIAMVCVLADRRRSGGGSTSEFTRRLRSGATAFVIGGGLAVVVVSLMTDPRIWFGDGFGGGIDASRNFFGLVRIKEGESQLGKFRKMVNGKTSHGVQYLGGADEAAPRSYFGPRSGLGVALEARRLRVAGREVVGQERARRPLRIGAVGLGVGTVAAAAEPGDSVRVYEINPEVERLARKHFTYLSGAAAAGVDVEVVIGDARVSLDREAERGELHGFDVLVVDAFNGDSVPIHLITHDAYALYRRHLQPDGVIAFHVSNRYLGLTTIVRAVVESSGDQAVRVLSADEPWSGNSAARWVLASSDRAALEAERVRVESTPWLASETPSRVWTDDFASLWDALRLGRSMAPGKWDDAPNGGRFVIDDGDLISEADEDHIRRRCRAMYSISGGRNPVFVTAISSAAAGSDGAPPFDGAAHPSAVLLTCSDDDQHVALRFGAGWPPESRERVTSAVSSAFMRRAASDGMSAAVRAAIDVLEPLTLAR